MVCLLRKKFAEHDAIPVGTLPNWEVAKLNDLTEKGAFKLVSSLAKLGIHCNFEWLMYSVGADSQTSF